MDSEIHYEGWLIKSPPTKRIWRARWRRRWFALKQGELPGQYMLEYYTDQSCRKLKGVIELDQCEQVDAGLFMERKFQHVFNVKTPRRTYYLAADTDEVMRYWVNCICNVCGLQDLSKLPNENIPPPTALPSSSSAAAQPQQPSYFNVYSTDNSGSPTKSSATMGRNDGTYQNNAFVQKLINETMDQDSGIGPGDDRMRFNTMQPRQDRLGNLPQFSTLPSSSRDRGMEESPGIDHEYYNDVSSSEQTERAKPSRPIPEKLNLFDAVANNETSEPSPALSTASGPYIPISECFSGSPVLHTMGSLRQGGFSYENNFAPLNSLSRNNRFDIPRSPLNLGQLNLTEGPPPQSPKTATGARSSDDSESVFTDDEMASSHSGSNVGSVVGPHMRGTSGSFERRLRPSDSSIENENIGWTAMQRFSKVPVDEKCLNSSDPPPRPPKRLEDQPAIGPLDSSSCVIEERYEIPRSHRNPQANVSGEASADKKVFRNSHFYTNAAPSEGQVFRYDFVEESEGAAIPPPAINRSLKPKMSSMHVPSKSCDRIETPPMIGVQGATSFGSFDANTPGGRANTLNRFGQPGSGLVLMSASGGGGATIRNNGTLGRLHGPGEDEQRVNLSFQKRSSALLAPSRSDDKLQYLDLDHTNAAAVAVTPSRPESIRSVASASVHNILHVGLPAAPATMTHSVSEHGKGLGGAATSGFVSNTPIAAASSSSSGNSGSSNTPSSGRGVVYKTVDFVKTEAFNRTRQDAEMSRASNKDK